jgi:hypothetical protein
MFTTCLFDLKSRESVSRRDIGFYLSDNILLNSNINLVIYCEPNLVDEIEKYRKKNTLGRIDIIPIKIEDTYPYVYYDKLKENYNDNKIKDSNPNKDTPLYMVVMWLKYYLVRKTMIKYPSYTHYGWIDFGIGYSSNTEYLLNAINYKPEKFRLSVMNYYMSRHSFDDEVYYTRLPWIMTGNFTLSSKKYMEEHCTRYDEEYERVIEAGYCPTDEQIIGRLFAKHQEDYEYTVSDYNGVLANFDGIVRYDQTRVKVFNDQLRDFLHNDELERYGYYDIPNYTKFSNILRNNFHHFIELQKIVGKENGCGSYLIDGSSMKYCSKMWNKQNLFFNTVMDKDLIEVGVFTGHSALIMLLSSPDTNYVGIDICEHDFTKKCVEYLTERFPSRVTLWKGKGEDLLLNILHYANVSGREYVIHLDGDHGPAVKYETDIISKHYEGGQVIIFDDYDSVGVQLAFSFHENLILQKKSGGLYQNCVAILCKDSSKFPYYEKLTRSTKDILTVKEKEEHEKDMDYKTIYSCMEGSTFGIIIDKEGYNYSESIKKKELLLNHVKEGKHSRYIIEGVKKKDLKYHFGDVIRTRDEQNNIVVYKN